MSYPCDPTNKQIQMFYGKWSLTPTNSALVVLFVFSFCFLDLQCTIPYPKDMQPPVCVFKSGCTPYVASTHVHNCLRLSDPIILLLSMVCFRYWNTSLNFALYYLVLSVSLVHRNDMASSILVLPLFSTHSNFATMEFRISTYFLSSLVEISYMFCVTFFAGDDTFVINSSLNK